MLLVLVELTPLCFYDGLLGDSNFHVDCASVVAVISMGTAISGRWIGRRSCRGRAGSGAGSVKVHLWYYLSVGGRGWLNLWAYLLDDS